jgi:thiol:disulfide interchange protein DsbD
MLLAACLHAGMARADEEFLDPDKAFVFSAATQTPGELAVHFEIAPGYYMYRKRFEIATQPETASAALGQAIYPDGIIKYDPTFDEDMEVYHDQVTIRVPLQPGVATPFTVDITGQGCADAGLCYPPDTRSITLTPVAGGYQADGDGVKDAVPPPAPQKQPQTAMAGQTAGGQAGQAMDGGSSGQTDLAGALDLGDTGMAAYLANAGWAQIILLCLILGLLLSFTPCVLPMVPILLAILAGTAGTGRKVSRWRGVSLAAVFVLGMSLVYTALGIAAGLVGASLAVWLQTPWVLAIFALLLALLALAMFDVFTLQAPAGMQSALNERMSRIPGGHYSGAFVMGMLSALIVGPCVAAPLAGILLFISQSGDVLLGGSALFALAWGEGLLLLAVGASSGLLLPKAGAWMVGVKHLFGILLLATAWWMLNAVLPAWIFMLGWAVLSLWAATLLGAFEGLRAGAGVWRYLRKALGLLFALWGAALLIGLAMGGRDVLHPLAPLARAPGGQAQAVGAAPDPAAVAAAVKGRFVQIDSVQALDNLLAQTSRPVMLDFYADWCVSCIEMERFTFSDPQVAQLLSQFVLVQADVTKNLPEHRALLKRFKLFGPPGIMFFDGSGRQLEDIRVVGFRKARDFEAVLRDVLGQKTAPASAS